MNNLIASLKDSMFLDEEVEKNIEEIIAIIQEPIEVLSNNPVVKSIPVVKTVVSLSKTALAIRDRILVKNLMKFIKSVNDGSIRAEDLDKYKQKIEDNPKILNRDLEQILILMDKESNQDKIKILIQLYKSYINESIDWEDFMEFSEITDRLFLSDIFQLKNLYNIKQIGDKDEFYPICMNRLSSLGLVNYYNGMVVRTNEENPKPIKGEINELGESFYEYGILNSELNLDENE